MKKRDYINGIIRIGSRLESCGKLTGETLSAIHKLRHLEKKHRRICEAMCNTGDDLYATIEKVETKAEQVAASARLYVDFQRDPRGLTVKLATTQQDLEQGGNLNIIFE